MNFDRKRMHQSIQELDGDSNKFSNSFYTDTLQDSVPKFWDAVLFFLEIIKKPVSKIDLA